MASCFFDPVSRERLQTKDYNLHSPGNYGKYNNDIIMIVQKLYFIYIHAQVNGKIENHT